MIIINTPHSHRTSPELQNRKYLARTNRDFGEAIALALEDSKEKNFWFCEDESIAWLCTALSFKSDDTKLEDFINLDEFFSSFTRVHCPYLFADSARPFLNAFKRNKTITQLDLSCHPNDNSSVIFNYANSNFIEYIAQTKSLKELDISAGRDKSYTLKMEDIQSIAHGLKLNTSIQQLNIEWQPIGDAGLNILLEALSNDPKGIRLRELNLYQTGLTDKGAELLIHFLKKNITLTSVKLKINPRYQDDNSNTISDENMKQIKYLTEMNKKAHRIYCKAGMAAFFAKIGQLPELGWKVGEYLGRYDGRNIALTCKATSEAAKQAEDEIQSSKLGASATF